MSDESKPKTLAELGAIEQGDRVLIPETIKRRKADGSLEEVPIFLRVLRQPERVAARLEAKAWAKQTGIDPVADVQFFDEMETLFVLARAIRDAKNPTDQYQKAEWLAEHFDLGSLAQLSDKLDVYRDMVETRESKLSDEDFWKTTGRIATEGNPLAMGDLEPRLQRSYMVSLAREALLSPRLTSFVESRTSSTQEPSASTK